MYNFTFEAVLGRGALNYTPKGFGAHILNLSLYGQWSRMNSFILGRGVGVNTEIYIGDSDKWQHLP